MTKKKKIILGSAIGVVAIVVIFLLLAFVFDTFGFITNQYRVNYSKYIKLGDYKGLTYDKVSVSVTDKEIQSEIKTRVKAKASTKSVKSGTVADGDTISVDYVGKINGKTFSGGSAEDSNITIGTTSMIDGFTDGLIGKSVGSKVTLHLKFPSDYSNTKVAGKKVVFTVTINSKQVKTTPTYNLAFVKKYSKYDTIKDYEASVKKSLLKTKKESAETTIKNTLWNQIVADTTVKKYPEKQYKYEQEQVTQKYKKMAKNYNLSWKKFLKNYMGTTESGFKTQAKAYAKTVVKQKLVMYDIAKKENLKVTNKEYKKYLSNLLSNAGFTESSFKKQYNETIEEYGEENDFKTNLLLQKVMDKVLEEGKAK
ncbi:trigger factor [Aminicella lysinilytica]|mgnify:CR=1 FL=1|uniref:trigger factor n=1 Tax=Aminicella lysinilytica TaxID=433323 RepID=UPI0026F13AC3|nr:trigger factor [Aminicella lysinilytica]